MTETEMFIIAQTIILLIAIVSAWVGLSNKIAIVETNQANILKHVDEANDRHNTLESKVHGISRRTERHQAILEINGLDKTAQG